MAIPGYCADDCTTASGAQHFLQREHRSMRANVDLDHILVRFSPDCRWDRMEPQVPAGSPDPGLGPPGIPRLGILRGVPSIFLVRQKGTSATTRQAAA